MTGSEFCRRGYVLLEALMALVVVTIAYLVLEGAWTLVVRKLFEDRQSAAVSLLADSQRERAAARGCVESSGSDSVNGITINWWASSSGGLIRVSQARTYRRDGAQHADSSVSMTACR